ncbi:hypothetical protein [Oceanobacillus sp. CAU 1775]
MTKKKLIIYAFLGVLTGMVMSNLFPPDFHGIFGEPTAFSKTLVTVIGVSLILCITIPLTRYYNKLEN